jgi:hypothetical protein
MPRRRQALPSHGQLEALAERQEQVITIETTEKPVELGVKRFCLPCKVTATCPECGKQVERDFMDSYLSYPTANEPLPVTFYHEHDDGKPYAEWSVQMVLRLTLELAEDTL